MKIKIVAPLMILLGTLIIAMLLSDDKAIRQVSLPEEEVWQLPKGLSDKSQKYYKSLQKRQPWGREEGEEAESSQEQILQWQLVGIVKQSDSKQVLIMMQEKLDTFQQGQTLPDGSIIKNIEEDFITIEKDQQQLDIDLYYKNLDKDGESSAKDTQKNKVKR